MHIAYLVNQYPKVSHSFIRREIRALERQGLSVMRIAIRGWKEPLVDPDDLEEQKVTRYVLKRGALELIVAFLRVMIIHPLNLLRATIVALKLGRRSDRPLLVHLIYVVEACQILLWLRRSGISHIHAHFGTNSAEVAMLVHILGDLDFSFTVHGPEEFDKPHSIGLAQKIRRAAFVIAVSSFGRSQLFRFTAHHDWKKIFVVHCGLEPEYFRYPAQSRESRNLVCVGRLNEQKGQLLLLDAARRLVDRGIVFQLVLAGDGELRPTIEKLIETHKLHNHVRITGWISGDDVRNEILDARALVMPSFAEGLPVAIMEAMALRRPVIATYIAGIPELVGDTGWLVPAGDVEALADAIEECLNASSGELKLRGEKAYLAAIQRHNIEQEAAKLAQLFRRFRDKPAGG